MDDVFEQRRLMLLEQLRALQLEYQAAAKPIIDKLVDLENLRPPRPFIVPASMSNLLDLPPDVPQ